MLKVSVIISTYNRADMLKKILVSIQNQTFRNIEIIVCDDGSTDFTREIVNKTAEKDKRVRYIDCGHSGRPAIPRNIGIKNSKGEWLAFGDDDDEWNPTKLEAELFLAKKNNTKAVCTNAYIIESGRDSNKLYFENLTDRKYTFKDFINVNPVINSSVMIHRSLIDKCLGYPEGEELRAVEDYAFWLRIACYTPFYFCSMPFIDYMYFNPSSIRNKKNMSFEEQKAIVDNDFNRWLKDQDLKIKAYVIKEKIINGYNKICEIPYNYAVRVKRKIIRLING